MKFTDIFIRRPVLAIVVNLVIIIAGFQAMRTLNVRQYPRSENASVTVTTVYVGASAELVRGFELWKQSRGITKATFPGVAYVMLHSLAHLLIQSVALECGYAATAISERIYAGAGGYGILLYTGTTGSEGTLGGLVDIGRRIEHYLLAALDLGRLCSNDPICAQHAPEDRHEDRHRHGAACHGCLLIAEPSCESRNEFHDRALVVPTVDLPGAAFFTDAP